MKITDVQIEGFGVWNDLRLDGLSPHLTAFYGANEAGKTTLMQFTRGVLYGMSPLRRERYMPPVNGGRPGGALNIIHDHERLHVSRIADRGPDDFGLVSILDSDGKATGDRLLREALCEVDEPTFNNVFAIGLSEIQHLGTLSDTQASEWLYRLTSGLDRVSLYDVIQGIRQTRSDLLSPPDPSGEAETSKIIQLMNRRDVLQGEIRQLSQRNREWAQLEVRIQELDEEISGQEQTVRVCERRARTIEIAVGLKPNWRKRMKLEAQLTEFTGNVQMPADALDRLDELNSKIEKHQREADILSGQRQQLSEEVERLGINERLTKCCCRIDALGEQRDWLQSLERQIEDLDSEAEHFEQLFENEQERLGEVLGVADSEQLELISNTDFESLQPQVKELRTLQKQVDRARLAYEEQTENERSLQVKIESAIVGGENHGLPMDVREASDLVGQLRTRLKVEQRLEQAHNHEVELEEQSHDLLDDQVLPLTTFNWIFAMIVIGSLFGGIWLFWPGSPLGPVGPLIGGGGFVLAVFLFFFKLMTENTAAEKLDACQDQMELVARQIKEAEKEKERLDAELPMTDGSVMIRLQAAERHLAELENMLPVEAERKQASHEVVSAETRLKQTQEKYNKALASWKTKLVSLGFSEELDPERLLTVTERYTALSDLESRAKLRREDAAARQREHESLHRRIRDLAEEVDCILESEETEVDENGEEYEVEVSAFDQLEYLLSERRRQQADVDRRKDLFERAKQLKGEEGSHRRAIVGFKRRRNALFETVNCDDESDYRRLMEDQKREQQLISQLEGINREIVAAIGSHAAEETFGDLLSPERIGTLEDQWEEATAELELHRGELTTLVGKRGALREQQRAMAEDRSLAESQLELGCVEQQLADARKSWREHATVSRVLERIRAEYEAHRQPETLEEASKYMNRLTGGEYQRVWTPLAEDILLVQNSEGDSLTVEHLSRGTREQLFLSVRLAIVAMYGRRGVKLPMVLDDILVNFDAIRAQRAAEVLCEFSAGGHQIMLFTCHEHMWQMFKGLQADCRRLPTRGGVPLPEPEPIIEEPVAIEPKPEPIPEPKPKPKKKRRPKPVVVEEVPEPVQFYDYPFEERIEEEIIEQPVENLEQPIETVYEWEAPEPEPVQEPQDALAYIVTDSVVPGTVEGVEYSRRDHLEPRRA